ncbi:imidazole glycerol phosphate synthase subunit HisH [Nodosilinea sp. LEGE 06152]|uniref:imidazole glycerol phosphate synthase subunit HisH n=1 Tax=Nodosilinea sp. LEGE 06152 TaxID=2777966 RepID=UPI00187F2C05|nr:imidazole glycerol phosphate synthase subunit HisH [Nodosilinea sp. LEGE 06152]MBE9157909.1 imidazole glycerol phosphate synthase subunit HisH [Nodosilinea sp. LEGE 06152]
MIVILDYGMGNLGSVLNMLRRIGAESTISSDPVTVSAATKLILPGVGAFDRGMQNLAERGLLEPLNRAVLEQHTPVLGICLGIQLMTRRSEEGTGHGLGWFAADTVRFQPGDLPSDRRHKIPHMGWNEVSYNPQSRLFKGWEGEARFYFVHSYYVFSDNPQEVAGTAAYGRKFVACLERDHIFGVQFHPEKSHRYGMQLLKNFAEL